jgi:hypothetical protein
MSSGPFAPTNSSSEAPRQKTQGFAHRRRCPKDLKNAAAKNVETCSQMRDERQIRSMILQKVFFEKCSHLMSPNSVCSHLRLKKLLVQTSAKSGNVHTRIQTQTHKCYKNPGYVRKRSNKENEATKAWNVQTSQKTEEDWLVFESEEAIRRNICKMSARARTHTHTHTLIRALVALENEATKSQECPNLEKNRRRLASIRVWRRYSWKNLQNRNTCTCTQTQMLEEPCLR